MSQELEKKYGLFTASCLVVGIVIGSGVFFKAPYILNVTGSLQLGIWAWIIGGVIMLLCAYCFATIATQYEKTNGLIDYAEAVLGSRYAYVVGWFMCCIYNPSLCGALAYVAAVYTSILFQTSSAQLVFPLTLAYALLASLLNALAPRLAGRVQVSTTIIKLIPLLCLAVVGTAYGLHNGQLQVNFATQLRADSGNGHSLLAGVVATAFAYDGWIVATSINAEMKNARRDLPRALLGGGLLIVLVYISYFIGIGAGASNIQQLTVKEGVTQVYNAIFGPIGGTILIVFVIISCLGSLNGLSMGCVRGMYALAIRGTGPAPRRFAKLDPYTGMPMLSCLFGTVLSLGAAGYFFCFDFLKMNSPFFFDITELPVVSLYALFIPIFLGFARQAKSLGIVKRWIIPLLSCGGAILMLISAISKYAGRGLAAYLICFTIILSLGLCFNHSKSQ